MTDYVVSSGMTSSGITLNSGDTEEVLSGGVSIDTTVNSGGVLTGKRGGLLSGGLIASGGVAAGAGSVAGMLEVSSGGSLSGLRFNSGATDLYDSGASEIHVTIASGGTLILPDYIISSGASPVPGGGVQLPPGAQSELLSATVLSGGILTGGAAVASASTVSNGGTEVLSGRTGAIHSAYGGVVYGVVEVGFGAYVSGVVIASGGLEIATTKSGAGFVTVLSGGTVTESLQISRGVTVTEGVQTATVTINGATFSSGATLSTSGGTVSAGGLEIVPSGVVDVADRVLGSETVLSGGAASKNTITGHITVSSGGVLHGGQVSGVATVLAGGVATATFVSRATSGTAALNVSSGGVVEDLVVGGRGVVALSSGAVMEGGAIEAGGVVSGAGLIKGNVDVTSGGRIENVRLTSGVLEVEGGATAENFKEAPGTKILDYGVLLYSGALTRTFSGLLSGSGKVVQDGPGTFVQAGIGTTFTGQVVISGGTVELQAPGGLGNAVIGFAAPSGKSAVLLVDKPSQPVNGGTFFSPLSNFRLGGDAVDLANQAYVSGATATVSGVALTLSDGGYGAYFLLAGKKAGAYIVSDDGDGGTLITPVVSQAAGLTSALAVFDGGAALPETPAAPSVQSAYAASLVAPHPLRPR